MTWAAFTALAALCSLQPAAAQSLFSTTPSTSLVSPGSQGGGLLGPGGNMVPPAQSPLMMPPGSQSQQAAPMVPAGKVALGLTARFGREGQPITSGLTWRVYNAKPESNGTYHLVKEEAAPSPMMVLSAGSYIVHVSFGLANAAKPVTLRAETVHEAFDLPAGGLRLEGKVGETKIPGGQVSFDVYRGSQFEPGDRRPIAERVMAGDLLIVPEGTYYIVSNYGGGNSVVRSDIQVQAAKLTDITVTHRAAMITLKLVGERGGEALANTAWSVLTPGGDVIKESIGAFPRVVLAEGEYRAIAKYEGRMYEREFKVINGVDGDIEVMAR